MGKVDPPEITPRPKGPPAPAEHLAEWLQQVPEQLEARKTALRKAVKNPRWQTRHSLHLIPDEVEAAIRMVEGNPEPEAETEIAPDAVWAGNTAKGWQSWPRSVGFQ